MWQKSSDSEVVFFSVLDRSEARALAFNFCAQSDMCNLIPGYEIRIWRDIRKSVNAELSDLLTYYARQKVKCSSKIVEGPVKDEVIREANSGVYQLIVMGAYGKSGKSHTGTLFERIAGLVDPRSLLSARPSADHSPVAVLMHSSVVPSLTAAPHISGT